MHTFSNTYVFEFPVEVVYATWISEVEVIFEARPDGSAVQLTHSGFQSATSLENHSTGWDSYIDGLSDYFRERQQS